MSYIYVIRKVLRGWFLESIQLKVTRRVFMWICITFCVLVLALEIENTFEEIKIILTKCNLLQNPRMLGPMLISYGHYGQHTHGFAVII